MNDLRDATPSEVVSELWRRLAAEDYAGAAMLHTEEFAEHARGFAVREGTPRVVKPRTADQMLAMSPDMPREVAEWEAAQYRKQPAPSGYFGAVHGVESLEQLNELSAREVLARRLQAADWRTRLRPHLDDLAEQHPAYRDQLEKQRDEARSQWNGRIVGHVIDEGRAYVILDEAASRAERGPADWSPLVLILRRTEEGWRVSSDLTSGNMLVHFHITVEGPNGDRIVLS